ncbi:hypothetical protein [Streptomyces sp. TLI_146]|uniref:hypothetical protein n=1 Tax=Streptomyces sp. TLI_146 TaxID=1938858 RepID=UPI0015D5E0A5|nr:hypothetical protein [Streptomyces sp. TLI_146]
MLDLLAGGGLRGVDAHGLGEGGQGKELSADVMTRMFVANFGGDRIRSGCAAVAGDEVVSS